MKYKIWYVILLGVVVWLTLTMYMSLTLYHSSSPDDGKDPQTKLERQLIDVAEELATIREENKKLQKLASELRSTNLFKL